MKYIILAIIVIAFIGGKLLYPHLPDQIVSHWNAVGEANGHMVKFWGVFLVPIIMIGLYIVYWIIPKVDPLKHNIQSFKKFYNWFWLMMFLFLSYIYGLSLYWNTGHTFNFATAIVPALAILWVFVGIILHQSKRNWFIGVRTPWTLSSDVVWEKTNRLGGKLFIIAAVVALIGTWFPKHIVWFVIIPVAIVIISCFIYSYIVFKNTGK